MLDKNKHIKTEGKNKKSRKTSAFGGPTQFLYVYFFIYIETFLI